MKYAACRLRSRMKRRTRRKKLVTLLLIAVINSRCSYLPGIHYNTNSFSLEPGVFTCSVCRLETTVSLYSPLATYVTRRCFWSAALRRFGSAIGDTRSICMDIFSLLIRTRHTYYIKKNKNKTLYIHMSIRILIIPDTRYLVIFTRYREVSSIYQVS